MPYFSFNEGPRSKSFLYKCLLVITLEPWTIELENWTLTIRCATLQPPCTVFVFVIGLIANESTVPTVLDTVHTKYNIESIFIFGWKKNDSCWIICVECVFRNDSFERAAWSGPRYILISSASMLGVSSTAALDPRTRAQSVPKGRLDFPKYGSLVIPHFQPSVFQLIDAVRTFYLFLT